jgi:hypothetical protein
LARYYHDEDVVDITSEEGVGQDGHNNGGEEVSSSDEEDEEPHNDDEAQNQEELACMILPKRDRRRMAMRS